MSFFIACTLAWRYVTSKATSTITTMIHVCYASIFIGTVSITLIACIMRGFEYETHKKLQSIYPSIIISAPEGATLAHEPIQKVLQKTLQPYHITTAPYLMTEALIHPATTDDPSYVVTLKGIDPLHENNVTNINKMIVPYDALYNLAKQEIVLGKGLIEKLSVSVGDTLVLVCNQTDQTGFKDANLRSIPVTIAGIITTGITDYDDYLLLASLDLCYALWGNDCVTHVGIGLNNQSDEKKVLESITKIIPGVEAYSWKKLYPALVSALLLEKYVMFFILLLIMLIASMNMISLLFMYITYKRTDSALLTMLGMETRHIISLFLIVSLIITAIASTTGLIVAYGLGLIIQTYPFISLPDVYYLSHLPIKLELVLFLKIFLSVLGLSIVSSLLPLKTLKKLTVTETLRFE